MRAKQAKNEFNLNVYLTLDGKSESAVKLISAGLNELLDKISGSRLPQSCQSENLVEAKKEDRETILKRGLDIFLNEQLQDFFTDVEIRKLADMFMELRYRKSGSGIPNELCKVITRKSSIVSFTQPSNEFRKDEIGILFNNIMPYAHLSRKEASLLIKMCFPTIYANTMPSTINSTLTKFKNMKTGQNRRTLNVTVLGIDSAKDLETYLYNLASNNK